MALLHCVMQRPRKAGQTGQLLLSSWLDALHIGAAVLLPFAVQAMVAACQLFVW
jgi:hypothetical protein